MNVVVEMYISEAEPFQDVAVDIEYRVDPYDPGVSMGPVEICRPPSGGHIEDLYAVALLGPSSEGTELNPVDVSHLVWRDESLLEHLEAEASEDYY